MNHIRHAAAWAAIVLAAAFAAFYSPSARSADVHVCSGISDNALILYKMVAEGQEPEAIVANMQEAVDAGLLNIPQASVLVDGLVFLVQVWGHPDLNPKAFQQVARQVCEARFGQLNDRNNV